MERLSELYESCRSYRRFEQREIPDELLKEIVETAGRRSSGMNAQPLRYLVVSSKDTVGKIQHCMTWAAKLPKEIGTPKEGEQPTAFIIVLSPEKAGPLANIDLGIALDTMAITAWQQGVGSCIIYSVNRDELSKMVPVPEGFVISIVLALGYPSHKSKIVKPDEQHGLSYYVDDCRDYYVPKRPAEEIISYI